MYLFQNKYAVPLTCCVLTNNDHKNPNPKNTTLCQADGQRNDTESSNYLYPKVKNSRLSLGLYWIV